MNVHVLIHYSLIMTFTRALDHRGKCYRSVKLLFAYQECKSRARSPTESHHLEFTAGSAVGVQNYYCID